VRGCEENLRGRQCLRASSWQGTLTTHPCKRDSEEAQRSQGEVWRCWRSRRSSSQPLRRAPALATATALAALGCGRDEPRLDALLVTFDTTRTDAVASYDARRGQRTPSLDRLAAEGVAFERAFSVAPLTLPSHASMLTGLYPLRHGVRDNGSARLPAEAETVAERARAAGYRTAAFVGARVLAPGFGLEQGFEVYDAPDARRTTTSHFAERPAGEVTDAALAWLAARERDRPFFLWVHFFDPHAPYDPPPGFARGASNQERYRGEVAYADRELGRLLAALEAEGSLDTTLVVVAADHGESFGEHGEKSHGAYCYQPTIHVPLVLRAPRGSTPRAPGTRSDATVSVADVGPTLADAMGLALPGADGTSLLRGDPAPDRGVYFESYDGFLDYGWSPLAGWADRAGKYLHSSEPELYDLAADPKETRELLAERPGLAGPYRDAIAALASLPRLRADDEPIDPDVLADVRALGYAVSGPVEGELPSPLDPTERPSPRSMADVYGDLVTALALSNAGRWEDAAAGWESVLARNPENRFALEHLAQALLALERPAEAIAPLERLVREGPHRAADAFNLGACLEAIGESERAAEAYRRAVELEPGNPRYRARLVELLQRTGRNDEAREIEAGARGEG